MTNKPPRRMCCKCNDWATHMSKNIAPITRAVKWLPTCGCHKGDRFFVASVTMPQFGRMFGSHTKETP